MVHDSREYSNRLKLSCHHNCYCLDNHKRKKQPRGFLAGGFVLDMRVPVSIQARRSLRVDWKTIPGRERGSSLLANSLFSECLCHCRDCNAVFATRLNTCREVVKSNKYGRPNITYYSAIRVCLFRYVAYIYISK